MEFSGANGILWWQICYLLVFNSNPVCGVQNTEVRTSERLIVCSCHLLLNSSNTVVRELFFSSFQIPFMLIYNARMFS